MHGKLYLEQGDEKDEEHDFESHFGHIPQTKGPGWPGDEQAGSGVLGLVCSCSACSACVKDSSELTACMTATQLGMGTRLSLASQLRCSLWLFVTSYRSDELCKVVTVLKTCMYCHPETCNATYLKEIIKHFFSCRCCFRSCQRRKQVRRSITSSVLLGDSCRCMHWWRTYENCWYSKFYLFVHLVWLLPCLQSWSRRLISFLGKLIIQQPWVYTFKHQLCDN